MEFKYPERRREQRRQNGDRRALIRFELDKPPRRSGRDRRIEGVWEGRQKY